MYPFELLKWFKKIATLGGHSALENQGTLFKMQEEETLEALQPENKIKRWWQRELLLSLTLEGRSRNAQI